MKDRFKFRGLSKGKWYYGAYFKHLPYTPYCCDGKPPEKDYKHLIIQEGFSDWGLPRSMTCTEVEKDTVGQCTGLKDKNGKLIYEEDIVKLYNQNYKIIYEQRGAYFGLYISKNETYYLNDINTQTLNMEIIGNIYENPELLEVNNEHT